MIKKKEDDEIDLLEAILIIWNNKLKVILITLLAFVITTIYLINHKPTKKVYEAETTIKPISISEEINYLHFNGYLESIHTKNQLASNMINNSNNPWDTKMYTTNIRAFIAPDREYLMNLFIDRLGENSIFTDAIKKFNLIKKENFNDQASYNNESIKLATSIKIIKSQDDLDDLKGWRIKFTINDKTQWENILEYINQSANDEIRKYLDQTFKKVILNEKRLREYYNEDIEIKLSYLSDNNPQRVILEKHKKLLDANKDIERMQQLFETTPIVNSPGEFKAAQIMFKSTKFRQISNSSFSKSKVLMIGSLLGLIVGMLYVLLVNAIRNRN